jgi:hypothetical protein
VLRRTGRLAVIGSAALAGAIAASSAQGIVRKEYLTSPVQVGEVATLVVGVSPSARCTVAMRDGIAVGTPANWAAKQGAHLTWRWRVSKTAPAGASPLVVSCGKAGTLRTKLTIVEPELSLADAVARICLRAPWSVMVRFGTLLVSDPYAPTNGCRFRVSFRSAPEFMAYYTLVVARTESCSFGVSTSLSVVRQAVVARYPGPFSEYYTLTCGALN